MAYTRQINGVFGEIGLTTAGYVLKNPDNTNNGSRITAGILEVVDSTGAGTGTYKALVSIPDGFVGTIVFDNGQSPLDYATSSINPEGEEYLDAKITSRPAGTDYTSTRATKLDNLDATIATRALETTAQSILTESNTHPTLAEIEATTILAKEATSQSILTETNTHPTATELDTTLTSSHGTGSWQQSLGGIGANVVMITLQETAGTPKIPSASVEVRNSAGDTLLATALTDSNGQAVFSLDNGTYKVYKQKLGSYSFTNPETLVVSGNTSVSFIGTPISVSAPSSPDICKLYIYAYNTDGTVITSGLKGTIRIKTLPFSVSTLNYEGEEIALQYDVTGLYWYANMPKGAAVIVNIFAFGYQDREAIVPDVTTKLIKDLTWSN